MQSISLYLKKFDALLPPDFFLRSMAQECVEQEVGVKIPLNHISVSGENIFIQTSSTLRSELLLHQKNILTLLHERCSGYKTKRVI